MSHAHDGLSTQSIAAAEDLAGVRYTEAERALMLDNLSGQIALAHRRRAVRLPHDLAPATRFDPRLPGFVLPSPSPRDAYQENAQTLLPDEAQDICFAPVTSLSGWIRNRAITAERLAQLYLDRIARFGPKLECMATVTADLAMEQARRADALLAAGTYLGPLHGIPWGCKDLLDTSGILTGWGAEPYADRVPMTDATVVQRLTAAGAVLVAKLTLGALAYGDIWYGGVTRNPWNLNEGASGSSAGSGAATAAGLVGFSLGTETLGSIVAPSLRCGTTGLRPTFGRVPRTGAMPLCWTLDKIGPMCRSVADTALVLAAINGADPADPCSIDVPFGLDATATVAGLRLGYYPADFAEAGADDLDRAMLDHARALGLTLVELSRPDLPYDALMNVLFAEAAASFEHLTLDDTDDSLTWQEPGSWPNTFRKARFLSAVDHIQLDRLRRRVMQDMDQAFQGVDAMIGPCLAGPMLIITNFSGHPSLTLRCGFRQSPTRQPLSLAEARLDQGQVGTGETFTVPHAISLYGRLFDEATILRIGRAMETRLDVAHRRPPLDA
ncbi:amidase [Lichenifustis flavocetrariae]|uniref:Amidase n=1 Tax=Lichenifustis flavocetrariae TaxID=2949735 RepID=A0AA41Z1E8_9HYPH|nr:amidase [Lichenifustis flavocetrariae]MCW6508738.1 amidase [Lichenifustis flavocetrariae]